MVTLCVHEQTLRNVLYCMDEFLSNSCNKKFMKEIIKDKKPFREAIGKAEGIPKSMLKGYKANDYRKYGLLRI